MGSNLGGIYQGQVRMQIPFELDLKRLTVALKEAGYYVHNENGGKAQVRVGGACL